MKIKSFDVDVQYNESQMVNLAEINLKLKTYNIEAEEVINIIDIAGCIRVYYRGGE